MGSDAVRLPVRHRRVLLGGMGSTAPAGHALHLLVSTETSANVTVPILAACSELHPDQLESRDYSQILL